ncbi:MAG: hypothetical protein ACTSXU_15635, partial [Promethearchaeota archaeon]
WDHYAWQLYRGNAVDPATDPQSTDIFERILTSVQFLGAKKTTPILGMTGVGDYGPNNCSLSPGKCNFAGVIKDCKIARALGLEEIQFFTLTKAGTINQAYYPSMFEAYGNNFLDVLNESVNGLENPEQLAIPGRLAFRSTIGYWWEDVAYSINVVTFLSILGVTAIVTIAAYYKIEIKSKKNTTDLPRGNKVE